MFGTTQAKFDRLFHCEGNCLVVAFKVQAYDN
jgi:hypothetical protein